jgi:hypothetical protein
VRHHSSVGVVVVMVAIVHVMIPGKGRRQMCAVGNLLWKKRSLAR